MREPYFEILAPAVWDIPVVFNSPHSGKLMPEGFIEQTKLNERELRQSEDSHVDELFSGCVDQGAPLLKAHISRAYLDLNREPYELDARMFVEDLPAYMNTGTPRVAAGFGTIPRCVGDNIEIYRKKLHLADALTRIDTIYRPYHRTLNGLLTEARERAGFALLLDCHSMPGQTGFNTQIADVVLGDRFGTSCHPGILVAIEQFFTGSGLRVARNKPYAGAFITSTYGAPQHNQHALQIELHRALYMNERSLEVTNNFATLKEMLTRLARQLRAIIQGFNEQNEERKAAE